ncbi:hypothetical protein F4859DRAFT_465206 [Xylaria cf. heliscus]|nr:hypothetical protein F4859DRAFT_465206 [Xylaria cf. heliscus]
MRRTLLRLAPSGLPNTHARTRPPPQTAYPTTSWVDHGGIKPGEHVTSVSKSYGIVFPNSLQQLRNPKLKGPYGISVSFSQQHAFKMQSLRYFDKAEHPFAKSLLEIYIEKSKEPLWIDCFSHGARPFPNRMAQRKFHHALREALAAAGYDPYGRRVLADGESSAVADLYGTLRVFSGQPLVVCDTKFPVLLEYAKIIIADVEPILQRDQNGRHLMSAPERQIRPKQGQKRWSGNQWGQRKN